MKSASVADSTDLLPDGNQSGTSPGDRAFRPDVQGLRGFIMLFAIFYHAQLFGVSGGFIGMDMFFVVSGFVMTGILLRERIHTDRTSFSHFYARRIRRILPAACFVILVVVAAAYVLLGSVQGAQTALSGFWSSLFVGNFHAISTNSNYFSRGAATSPLLSFWSLGVEEQFYIVFPALFVGAALSLKRYGLRVRLAFGLGLVVALSLAYALYFTPRNPVAAYYSPFTRFWEFAAGGLVAVATPLLLRVNRNVAAAFSWVGIGALTIFFFTYYDGMFYPGLTAIPPVVATVFVIAGGVHGYGTGAERLLGKKFMTSTGDVSYSLYLWHFPVLIIAAESLSRPISSIHWYYRLLLLAFTVGLSIGTYLVIENPIRHSRWLMSKRRRTFIMGFAIIAITATICGSLYFGYGSPSSSGSDVSPYSGSIVQLQREIGAGAALKQIPYNLTPDFTNLDPTTDINFSPPHVPQRCFASSPGDIAVPLCPLGDLSSAKVLVLLGDSQAQQWVGSFDNLAMTHHEKLYFFIKDGCPPWLAATAIPEGASSAQCAQFAQFALTNIQTLHPGQIYVVGGNDTEGGYQPTRDNPAIASLFSSLKRITPTVVTLSNIPWTNVYPPICIAANPNNVSACNVPVATLRTFDNHFREGLRDVAVSTHVVFLNVDPLLCDSKVCPRIVGNIMVYADSRHITWQYDHFVSNAFVELASPTLYPTPKQTR